MSIIQSLLSEAVSSGKRDALIKKILKLYVNDYLGQGDWYNYIMKYVLPENKKIIDITYDQIERSGISLSPEDIVYAISAKHEVDDFKLKQAIRLIIGGVKLFHSLEQTDPTKNMKYGNWLIDVVLKYAFEKDMFGNRLSNDVDMNATILLREKGSFFQDLPKMNAYLEAYHEAKRKNELADDYKDINKVVDAFIKNNHNAGIYDPFWIMNHITKPYRAKYTGNVFENIEENLDSSDYDYLGEADGFKLYRPLTQKAASVIGSGTEWCTTYGEHCSNPDYQGRSSHMDDYPELLIMINKTNSDVKYQLALESGYRGHEFMDKDDYPVPTPQFFQDHPELFDLIEKKTIVDNPYNFLKDAGNQEVLDFMMKYPHVLDELILHNELELPTTDPIGNIGLFEENGEWYVGIKNLKSSIKEFLSLKNIEKLEKVWDDPSERARIVNKWVRVQWESMSKHFTESYKDPYKYQVEISFEKALMWILDYNDWGNFTSDLIKVVDI